MARQKRKYRVNTVEDRKKLPPRREPYWKTLGQNLSVGVRIQKRGSEGNWSGRYRMNGEYEFNLLKKLEDVPGKDRCAVAVKKTMDWAEAQLGRDPVCRQSGTLSDGALSYIEAVERGTDGRKRPRVNAAGSAKDMRGRYRRIVMNDPIGGTRPRDLSKQHVKAWVARAQASMSTSDYNRNRTALCAVLNFLRRRGELGKDFWSELLLLLPADGRREGYLTREQRTRLIECASPEGRAYVRALCSVPFRPGDPSKLHVRDFDPVAGVLRLPKPSKVSRARVIPLNAESVSFFRECGKDKLPGAYLISRSDGSQWNAAAWGKEIREARDAAGLPRETCAYTLRHSLITDLLCHVGLHLFHVAEISGTSLHWIQHHYGHLQNDRVREALQRIAV